MTPSARTGHDRSLKLSATAKTGGRGGGRVRTTVGRLVALLMAIGLSLVMAGTAHADISTNGFGYATTTVECHPDSHVIGVFTTLTAESEIGYSLQPVGFVATVESWNGSAWVPAGATVQTDHATSIPFLASFTVTPNRYYRVMMTYGWDRQNGPVNGSEYIASYRQFGRYGAATAVYSNWAGYCYA